MDYRTHCLAGTCSGLILGTMIAQTPYTMDSVLLIGIVTISSAAGSFLPDIDEPNSKIGRKAKPISYLIHNTVGHRGMMHTPLIALFLTIILLVLKDAYLPALLQKYITLGILGFILGFLSHLFIDSLTKGGIAWLWPLSNRKFSLLPLYTNNKFHRALVRIATIIITFLVLFVFRGNFITNFFLSIF